ncbi:transcriptional regulator CadC, partial [Serratia marcescens]|nr:transcriptional regulator CadC [Serratia marcescens]
PEDGSEEDDETPYVPPRRTSVAPSAAPGEKQPRFYRRPTFGVWLAFLAALSVCVAFVGIATLSQRVPVSPMPVLLNPRDIDLRIQLLQLSYVVG